MSSSWGAENLDLNETAPRWERLRTRSSPHGVNDSRPSPAGARPGSTRPWNQGNPPCEFPPWPRRAAGSGRFGLLELRVFSTFLYILRAICSDHGYPAQCAANTSGPRSGHFWLLELRVSRTFLDHLRPQLSGHGYPTQRAANARKELEVDLNETASRWENHSHCFRHHTKMH